MAQNFDCEQGSIQAACAQCTKARRTRALYHGNRREPVEGTGRVRGGRACLNRRDLTASFCAGAIARQGENGAQHSAVPAEGWHEGEVQRNAAGRVCALRCVHAPGRRDGDEGGNGIGSQRQEEEGGSRDVRYHSPHRPHAAYGPPIDRTPPRRLRAIVMPENPLQHHPGTGRLRTGQQFL